MLRKEWFRPKKMRVLLAWIAMPFLIYYSTTNDTNYRWGVILLIIGEVIRVWALGFVEKKGGKLAMSGPYAFTRNPLYVGNFFLGLGIAIICANWIILGLFLVGFTAIYVGTIRGEEKDLLALFGPHYETYCKNVPRFFPRLTPYSSPTPDTFQWQRIIKHHEYVTILGLILAICGIHLYDELFIEKDSLASQAILLAVTVMIIFVLALERIFISNFKSMFAEGLPNLFLKKKK